MNRPDVIVVGAGAAGVSAALWARTLDLECVLIEGAATVGGQLHHVHFAPPDLAAAGAGDGPALADRLGEQLGARGVAPRLSTPAVALLAADGGGPGVRLADGSARIARAVLVATGCRRRRLGVPGEDAFLGRGVSLSATRDREVLRGRRVLVIGGGDAAYENAIRLARDGGEVEIIARGVPHARAEFQAGAAAAGVRVRTGVRVVAIHGDERFRELEVTGPGGAERVGGDGLVIKIGVEPNTAWCAWPGLLDARGHVRTRRDLSTPVPGVWAAGDATGPLRPSLAAAIGQGALAMAAIRAALRGD